jgi:hypothetical protein
MNSGEDGAMSRGQLGGESKFADSLTVITVPVPFPFPKLTRDDVQAAFSTLVETTLAR